MNFDFRSISELNAIIAGVEKAKTIFKAEVDLFSGSTVIDDDNNPSDEETLARLEESTMHLAQADSTLSHLRNARDRRIMDEITRSVETQGVAEKLEKYLSNKSALIRRRMGSRLLMIRDVLSDKSFEWKSSKSLYLECSAREFRNSGRREESGRESPIGQYFRDHLSNGAGIEVPQNASEWWRLLSAYERIADGLENR